jgi:hypothetical protein
MKASDLTGLIDWNSRRRFARLRPWLNFDRVAERKYNGDRASLHVRQGRSSFAGTRGPSFPYWAAIHLDEPVTIAGVELPGLAGTIIDGEFIAGFGPGGRELNRDITSGWFGSGPTRAKGYELAYGRPVFVAFDLPALAGTDMTRVPYEARRAALEAVITAITAAHPGCGIVLAEQLPASARSISRALDAGWEGLILKRRDSLYEAGQRSGAWAKVKATADLDVYLTGGWKPGEGSRTGKLGSVEVAIAGPGVEPAILGFVAVKPKLLDAYTDPETGGLRPELAGTVWEVRANGITPAGLLINPRMMHVRHDKTPADCGLEQLDALPAAA